METQDDPEKRIRDLERPLADAARASEIGADFSRIPPGAHPYPPPPPGPVPPPQAPPAFNYNYGGYSPTSPSTGGGNRMWWIIGKIIVASALPRDANEVGAAIRGNRVLKFTTRNDELHVDLAARRNGKSSAWDYLATIAIQGEEQCAVRRRVHIYERPIGLNCFDNLLPFRTAREPSEAR